MIDDYQYKPTPLSPKNEGLFGLGGQPSEGSRGFFSSIEDAGPSRRGGNDFGGGNNPYSGSAGVQQSYDPFPDAVSGDILYYNGDKWVTIPAPTGEKTYVLGFKDSVLQWIQTTDCDQQE